MNDNLLNACLLVLIIALGTAACASAPTDVRRKVAASTSAPVAVQVVRLPAVAVQGRRTPAVQTLALARAE